MIEAFLVGGALGAMVFVLGLPPLQGARLARRVEPYVSGLHGRPSRLLAGPREQAALGRWLEARWHRWRPGSNPRIDARIASAGLSCTSGEFRLQQLTWGIGLAVGAWVLLGIASLNGVGVNFAALPAVGLISFASGFAARDWWLGKQVEERRSVLQEELPTAIDLVTLSIMAGESVPASFTRVARVMHSEMGAELRRVVADMRAGAPIVEALEELKNRIPDYGVVRFVDALCTGIERGAPLADVLRAQADDGREARRRRLIELGGQREVLMLVPVVFLIMPVVIVFALLPGFVSLDLLVP